MFLQCVVCCVILSHVMIQFIILINQSYETKKITVKHIYTDTVPYIIIDQNDDRYLISKTNWEYSLKNVVSWNNDNSCWHNDHTYNIQYNVNNKHIESIDTFIGWDSLVKNRDIK